MPATIERPIFEEGQILGADDLGLMLNYHRDQAARHARCAHLWGIAEGLDVKDVDGNLEVSPGLAIDSSGASIVLTEKVIVTPAQFMDDLTRGENKGTYPLFLLALQNRASGQNFTGSCGTAAGYHLRETGQLRFGRAAQLVNWEVQRQPAIDKGPDDTPGTRRILLGFADWEPSSLPGSKSQLKNFRKQHSYDDQPDIVYRPRYIGVRAETVESATGQFTVRVRSAAPNTPMVRVSLQDPKTLFAFGLDDGRGNLNPLMWVDKDGNVSAKGVIKGAVELAPGKIYVQSGKATDGICLPLPGGITMNQVRSGAVSLHVMVTPRVDESLKPTGTGPWLPVVRECSFDHDTLQVQCVLDWFEAANMATAPITQGGVCDYLLVLAANASSGGGS